MSRIYVIGLGAVSPAGWGLPSLRDALAGGEPLPVQFLDRPNRKKPCRTRLVPNPPVRPAFLAHPRLRRSSPVTHYAAAAALEAMASVSPPGSRRLAVIVCLQSGCVQYSYRFFGEVLEQPATASPLVFPETVFAAPASHIATILGQTPLVYTLIGDPGTFLQGIGLAAMWLQEDRVDACLVLGAEETNWLRADALWYLEHAAIISGGAGAVCLSRERGTGAAVELVRITEPQSYTARKSRVQAARAMRDQLGPPAPGELLCDGLGDSPRTDGPEKMLWRDWTGPRLSPKRILGEGLMSAAAWQTVAACDRVASGDVPSATVSIVGCNQQAVGARFTRAA